VVVAGLLPVSGKAGPPARPVASAESPDHIARMIAITVNGETRAIPPAATVADLLREIGLAERKIAVERNAEIVPRSAYAETALAAGDALEIVHFIGGG